MLPFRHNSVFSGGRAVYSFLKLHTQTPARTIRTFAIVRTDTPAGIDISELVANSMHKEVERKYHCRFTFSAVEMDGDLHNEFSENLGISFGVLEMGTDVLLAIETIAYAFQETGSVACGSQEMGTVACAFLEMGTVACAFREMETVACAFQEMGILAYASLEMEIDVYLVKICA